MVEARVGNWDPAGQGGVRQLGRRLGNWLTGDQAQELFNVTDRDTLRGKRDAVLLVLLLGCGLRRSEAVSLRVDQLLLREHHWVITYLAGKGDGSRICQRSVDASRKRSSVDS